MQLFSSPDSPKPETFAALVDRLGGAEAIEALAQRDLRCRHPRSRHSETKGARYGLD
jgi:hypothetical protein